jgi:aldehyde:ferredoxin oxidoreductase
MVACLFARSVYDFETLAQCLAATGFEALAGSLTETSERIRQLRWQVRISTGFRPDDVEIPKRFYKVATIRGPVDGPYLDRVKAEYGRRIMDLGRADPPP